MTQEYEKLELIWVMSANPLGVHENKHKEKEREVAWLPLPHRQMEREI